MTMPKIMTDSKYRSDLILKTLFSYPSMAGLSEETGAVMICAYLEILTEFSDEVVEEAVMKIRRSPEKYAPSAGQIYSACKHHYRFETDEQYRLNCRISNPDIYGVHASGTRVSVI